MLNNPKSALHVNQLYLINRGCSVKKSMDTLFFVVINFDFWGSCGPLKWMSRIHVLFIILIDIDSNWELFLNLLPHINNSISQINSRLLHSLRNLVWNIILINFNMFDSKLLFYAFPVFLTVLQKKKLEAVNWKSNLLYFILDIEFMTRKNVELQITINKTEGLNEPQNIKNYTYIKLVYAY